MAISLTVYNQAGEKIASSNVPEDIFGLKKNNALVHQVYTVKLANQRIPYAHTKTRSEVRGGGRKPHPQKGTGRARHGSVRSPLWVGGGVTFGPRNERVFAKRINKKMNQKAIATVLSSKQNEHFIFVIDSLKFDDPKTKYGARLLDRLNKEHKSSLVFGTKEDTNFTRVFKNIPHIKSMDVNRINIVDLLHAQNCFFSQGALADFVSIHSKETVEETKKPKTKSTGKTKVLKDL